MTSLFGGFGLRWTHKLGQVANESFAPRLRAAGAARKELDPTKSKGRKRVDQREMLEGTIFRMRSGCQGCTRPVSI